MKKHLNNLQISKSEYEKRYFRDKEECDRLKETKVNIKSAFNTLQNPFSDMIQGAETVMMKLIPNFLTSAVKARDFYDSFLLFKFLRYIVYSGS
jgi:hypothetical protein